MKKRKKSKLLPEPPAWQPTQPTRLSVAIQYELYWRYGWIGDN